MTVSTDINFYAKGPWWYNKLLKKVWKTKFDWYDHYHSIQYNDWFILYILLHHHILSFVNFSLLIFQLDSQNKHFYDKLVINLQIIIINRKIYQNTLSWEYYIFVLPSANTNDTPYSCIKEASRGSKSMTQISVVVSGKSLCQHQSHHNPIASRGFKSMTQISAVVSSESLCQHVDISPIITQLIIGVEHKVIK